MFRQYQHARLGFVILAVTSLSVLVSGCAGISKAESDQTFSLYSSSTQLTNQVDSRPYAECSGIKLLEDAEKETVLNQALNSSQAQEALTSLRSLRLDTKAAIVMKSNNGILATLPASDGSWLTIIRSNGGKTKALIHKKAQALQEDNAGRQIMFLQGVRKLRMLRQLYNTPEFSRFSRELSKQGVQVAGEQTLVSLDHQAKVGVVALALKKAEKVSLEYTVLVKLDNREAIVSVVDIQPVKRCVITLDAQLLKHTFAMFGLGTSKECTTRVKVKVSFNLLIFNIDIEYEQTEKEEGCGEEKPDEPSPIIFGPCPDIPIFFMPLSSLSDFEPIPAHHQRESRGGWQALDGCSA